MKNQYTYLLFLCLGLAFSSCRCKDDDKPCTDPTNPKCENYDPCFGKKPTADFTVIQWDGWAVDPNAELPEDCDTILLHGIRLNPKINVPTNVFWQIGTDDREFTERELKMTFSEYRNNQSNIDPNNPDYYKPVPVTLTVRTPGWQECVAPKDTLLQHTRNVVFVNGALQGDLRFGRFKGRVDNEPTERTVEIVLYFMDSSAQSQPRNAFINFPNLENLDSIIVQPSSIPVKLRSFKQYWWDTGNDSYYYTSLMHGPYPIMGLNMGKIYIDPVESGEDAITFDYKYVNKVGQVKLYHFKGKRIL